MNVLDSPLEALALRSLSYDSLTVIINNFWTWVAVLTAGAISFLWTIKSPAGKVSPKSDPVCFCNPDSTKMMSPPLQSELLEVKPDSAPNPNPIEGVKATTAAPLAPAVTRGKFMVYYYEGRENVYNDEEEEREEDYVDGDGHAGLRWVNRWEWERIGGNEMGWYRYQDLTMLNGSVVRLWDDSRQKMATFGSDGVCCIS